MTKEDKADKRQWKKRSQDFGKETQTVDTVENNGHISEMVQADICRTLFSILQLLAAFLGTCY